MEGHLEFVNMRLKFRFLNVLGSGSSAIVLRVHVIKENAERGAVPTEVALKWGTPLKKQSVVQEHYNTLRVMDWDHTPSAVAYIRTPDEEASSRGNQYYLEELFYQGPGELPIATIAKEITTYLNATTETTLTLKRTGTLSKSPQFIIILPKMDSDLERFTPAPGDLELIDRALERLLEKMARENFEHQDFQLRNLFVCLGTDDDVTEVVLGDWGQAGPFAEPTIEARLQALRPKKTEMMEMLARKSAIRRRRK